MTDGRGKSHVGVAVFGTGLTGTEVVRACLGAGYDVVAGVVHDERKAGRDLGELTVGERLGVVVTRDLDAVLADPAVDILLHAGMGAESLFGVMSSCAASGKDAITASGFVAPATEFGAERVGALAERARASGARLLGTGMNPGLLLDVLPALLATTLPDPVSVTARRVTNMSRWSAEVLASELGFGGAPGGATVRFADSMAESVALIAAALGLELERVVREPRPVLAEQAVAAGGLTAEPGSVAGFDHRVTGFADGVARISLEWRGSMDPAADGLREGLDVEIDGPEGLRTAAHVDIPIHTYPPTAARIVKSIRPLRAMSPGLWGPGDLPVAGAAGGA